MRDLKKSWLADDVCASGDHVEYIRDGQTHCAGCGRMLTDGTLVKCSVKDIGDIFIDGIVIKGTLCRPMHGRDEILIAIQFER